MVFVLKVTVAILLVAWTILSVPIAALLEYNLFLVWLCGWLLIFGTVSICQGTWIIIRDWRASSAEPRSRA